MRLNKMDRNRTVILVIALFWTAFVLYGSLVPADDLPRTGWLAWIPYLDKIAHFVFYAGEMILLMWLFRPRTMWVKALLLLLVVFSSGVIEILQEEYVDRTKDIWDLTANTLGALTGLWVALPLKERLYRLLFSTRK